MLGLYGMLEFKLCCEILLVLNMADTTTLSHPPCSFNML